MSFFSARTISGKLRLLFAAGAVVLCAGVKMAMACTTCGCIANHHGQENCNTREVARQEHIATRAHITEEFTDWETFLREYMWGLHLHPALMLMTEQLTVVAMQQMFMVGAIMDADRQIETHRMFAQMAAQAHRDYHPDMGMCVFGTNVRSLAATERNAEFNSYVLSQRSQDRQMGNMLSVAARGGFDDLYARAELFRTRYCQRSDAGGELDTICLESGDTSGINKDLDYVRTVDTYGTISLDFSRPPAGTDRNNQREARQNVLALANNLYAHDLMDRIQETVLNDTGAGGNVNRGNHDEILDIREVVAKRSVAEHSFNTIIGMKSMASPSSENSEASEVGRYMKVILQHLGITDAAQQNLILGSDPGSGTAPQNTRPSYDAQMEILTKKIYEQPDFYVDLYQKPMNTERKKVAMQAIGLMQDFDTWESYLRTEAVLSVILELELLKVQTDVEDKLNRLGGGGQTRGGG